MELPGALLSPSSKNKKNPFWKTYILLKKSFSYISKIHSNKVLIFSSILGNENPPKIPYILGNGTFLYFRKPKP